MTYKAVRFQKNQLRRVLMCTFVNTADLVVQVGFSQSRTPVWLEECLLLWTESIPRRKTSQHYHTKVFDSDESNLSDSDTGAALSDEVASFSSSE